ncbi:MAG: DNA helicase RecQ [Oscillospiraceae bacterium]|nr:DNA helicase RecQ [Oscillospiraceae bacterium]
MTALQYLKRYFGYDSFREGQEALIGDILAGKDVLGIMPTGSGKSICFQVPSLMMDGITLIVSPLISLMKDQVGALVQSGVAAAYINSSLNDQQIHKALANAKKGMYKLIYVAPERLLTHAFLSFAQSADIAMLTVDEAHCISQWGQDFRPSYATIPQFLAQLAQRPVLSAFTATATARVRDDIVSLLGLDNPTVLTTGFNRPNLYFEVRSPKDKFSALTAYLGKRRDAIGIVYCSTRATVEDVCQGLNEIGYAARRYHAGLSDEERRANQDDFIYDRARIMVATNAFGMGIDKSNVSFVLHYNMPMSLEAYYQEAGRAGRDNGPADCILLYAPKDVHTNTWLIDNPGDDEPLDAEAAEQSRVRDRARLRDMTFYCNTSDCLRGYILKYFGEYPPNYCGNCGSCKTNFVDADVTVDAQQILSCVARMRERFGFKMVLDVLRGSKSERIIRLGLDRLSTYGINNKSGRQLGDIMNHLIQTGHLVKTDDAYPVLKLGRLAGEVLRGGGRVLMKVAVDAAGAGMDGGKGAKRAGADLNPVDDRLLAHLKQLRLSIAIERKMPAYIIFTDSALKDMCEKMPATLAEFLNVSGVGKVKMEHYGERFIKAIEEFKQSIDADPDA